MTSGETLLLVLLGLAAAGLLLFGAAVVRGALRPGPEDTPFAGVVRELNHWFVRLLHRPASQPPGDPLPREGPCIVVANHQSSVDPFLLSALTSRWIRFLMAREYYRPRWFFAGIGCIPVNRDGRDLGATRTALRALQAGKAIGVFPEGGIREADEGLSMAKAGVALLALRTGAPVVPLYVDGSPAKDSVVLGLLKPSRSRVYCGEPLRFGKAPGKPEREELERVTREVVEALAVLKREAGSAR